MRWVMLKMGGCFAWCVRLGQCMSCRLFFTWPGICDSEDVCHSAANDCNFCREAT